MRTKAEYRAEAAQFIRQADNAKNPNHRMPLMEHAKALTRIGWMRPSSR